MDLKDKIKLTIAFILVIIPMIFMFILSYNNPDMTQMRLLLTYWKQYIIYLIMIIGAIGISYSIK